MLTDHLLLEGSSYGSRRGGKIILLSSLLFAGLLGGALLSHGAGGQTPIGMLLLTGQPAVNHQSSLGIMSPNKAITKFMIGGHFNSQCRLWPSGSPTRSADVQRVMPIAATSFLIGEAGPKYRTGKDLGPMGITPMDTCENCVLAEYVWLDINQTPRSKTMTMTHIPRDISDLRTWNYDGSSTGQAPGENSEVKLKPVAIFKDPFRGAPHILVLAEAYNADGTVTPGNTRAEANAIMEKYKHHEPWFGMEQEYTFMRPGKVGEEPTVPLGFNEDGSEPAPQFPYYCSAGNQMCIGRAIADEHYMKCLEAGVKISGANAEVMPGQYEYQVGPCRGIEMGDHLTMARYIMLRISEYRGVMISISNKPAEGDWNGAGCHCNFSIENMRKKGGWGVIKNVCEAMGKVHCEHIKEYGEGNEKRLTGAHETCGIDEFKWAVADRATSIRIPRDTEKDDMGYIEDRRPGANCDPYLVTKMIMKTTGEALD